MGCGCKKKHVVAPAPPAVVGAPQPPPPPPPAPPNLPPLKSNPVKIVLKELGSQRPPINVPTAPKNNVDALLDKLNSIKG